MICFLFFLRFVSNKEMQPKEEPTPNEIGVRAVCRHVVVLIGRDVEGMESFVFRLVKYMDLLADDRGE